MLVNPRRRGRIWYEIRADFRAGFDFRNAYFRLKRLNLSHQASAVCHHCFAQIFMQARPLTGRYQCLNQVSRPTEMVYVRRGPTKVCNMTIPGARRRGSLHLLGIEMDLLGIEIDLASTELWIHMNP